MSFHKHLVGADLHSPSNEQVENQTGFDLLKHRVVRLDGFGIVFPKVALSNPSLYANFGIVQEDIINGTDGMLTCLGFMRSVNTSAWPVGTALYSDVSGNLTSTPLGGVVATVVKQHAVDGIIYVVAAADVLAGGVSNPWEIDGNAGTNPAINYIGTSDSQPLVVRTNAIEAFRVTDSQRVGIGTQSPILHVEQKTHSSANSSGLAQETFYVETNATGPQTAFSIPVQDPSVVSVEFVATARATDGSGRAHFKRSGLFYRSASSIQIQSPGWQSDITLRSNVGYNVSYSLGIGTLILRVATPTSTNTRWSGYVRIQTVN